MIEDYLIKSGVKCGTRSNFKDEVLKSMRLFLGSRWYFRTPVKISGAGLKTASLDMAFPFIAKKDDAMTNEAAVISRLEVDRLAFEQDLVQQLRKGKFIVPPDTVSTTIIPFWAGDAGYRDELEDFDGLRIHIFNTALTVKYRDSWF